MESVDRTLPRILGPSLLLSEELLVIESCVLFWNDGCGIIQAAPCGVKEAPLLPTADAPSLFCDIDRASTVTTAAVRATAAAIESQAHRVDIVFIILTVLYYSLFLPADRRPTDQFYNCLLIQVVLGLTTRPA